MSKINIAEKVVGENAPCYVIAEIGSNHNNNYDTALELKDAASEAGVDAVKLQTFYASQHYSRYTPKISIGSGKDSYDPYLLVESLEMNREWIPKLIDYALTKSVHLFSSPCDYKAIDLLSSLDVPAYKVSSFDLTDLDLIIKVAKQGKPVILSTGLASYADIERAVNKCYEYNNNQIILLQCTSLYPAPVNLSNLKAMLSMKIALNIIVGYSDHTLGDHICLAAVARGASVIEKHFTLDRSMQGPDHSFAIEPVELRDMINKIRDIEIAIGDGVKNGPRDEEMELFEKARRSVHAACDIVKGTVISREMLSVKRPSYGVEPYMIDLLIGKKAKRDIGNDEWIVWDDV